MYDYGNTAQEDFMEPSIPDTNATKYVRYRFKTKSVDDPRPLKKMPNTPYWISGHVPDRDFKLTATVIVCYLPSGVALGEYWDDAFDVTSEPADTVEYSGRFPRPEWLR